MVQSQLGSDTVCWLRSLGFRYGTLHESGCTSIEYDDEVLELHVRRLVSQDLVLKTQEYNVYCVPWAKQVSKVSALSEAGLDSTSQREG